MFDIMLIILIRNDIILILYLSIAIMFIYNIN
jgi:hypothetical protein